MIMYLGSYVEPYYIACRLCVSDPQVIHMGGSAAAKEVIDQGGYEACRARPCLGQCGAKFVI